MARVVIIEPREQAAHFGLYRTSAGGDEGIFVRRKVGEPTDFMHTNSRKLKILRDNLTLASQHYSHLTPSQKAISRQQIEEVEYIKSHGKTDTKLLMGRQLFIAKEMKSLIATRKQLVLPYELCIMLTDQGHNPLDGDLTLKYLVSPDWHNISNEQLATGSWLFSQVPRGKESYRIFGEALGFFDPLLPEHQFMSESQLLPYHYHKLLPSGEYWGYGFGSAYWDVNAKREAHATFTALHIQSTLTLDDFTGDMTIAVWKSGYPFPPEDEVASQTYPVLGTHPDPKIFYTTFSGLYFELGQNYWIRHMKSVHEYDLWEGVIHHWEF